MKNLWTICFLLFAFQFTLSAQNNKPKATYKVGSSKVTVWENEREGKYGKFIAKNFEVENVYKKDEKWESTNYFTLEELLALKAAIEKAIMKEGVEVTERKD